MKRISFIGLFTTIFFMSCILGVLLSRALLPSAMAVTTKTPEKSKLLLQFRNETPITSYNWGVFSEGQTKWLACQLTYTGKDTIEVLWNTTDFPLGWFLRIRFDVEAGRKWWNEGSTISFVSEETLLIQIGLKEVKGTIGRLEFFTLNFMSFK